jgi:hypothetical protein
VDLYFNGEDSGEDDDTRFGPAGRFGHLTSGELVVIKARPEEVASDSAEGGRFTATLGETSSPPSTQYHLGACNVPIGDVLKVLQWRRNLTATQSGCRGSGSPMIFKLFPYGIPAQVPGFGTTTWRPVTAVYNLA